MGWENDLVRGWWSGRDRAMLRAMLPVQRFFASLFSGEDWTPLVHTELPDVYASLWEESGVRLWTLVNRADRPMSGTILKASATEGMQYFDVIAGREISGGRKGGELEGASRGGLRFRGRKSGYWVKSSSVGWSANDHTGGPENSERYLCAR